MSFPVAAESPQAYDGVGPEEDGEEYGREEVEPAEERQESDGEEDDNDDGEDGGNDSDGDDGDGDGDVDGRDIDRKPAASTDFAAGASSPSPPADDGGEPDVPLTATEESELILRCQEAVLDCVTDRIEERRREVHVGLYRGYARRLVELLAPMYPWLDLDTVTSHLKRRRRTATAPVRAADPGGAPPPPPGSAGGIAPTRKRGRPPPAGPSRKRGRGAFAAAEGGAAAAAAASDGDDGYRKVYSSDEGGDGGEGYRKVYREERRKGGDAPKAKKAKAAAKEEDAAGAAKEEEDPPKPKAPRNRGGRPKGKRTKPYRPRGSNILTPEEKYDKDRIDLARDHAALEYHKARHNSEGNRVKKGVLEKIIVEAKKRFGLSEDTVIAHSTIHGRIKRGTLVARGTKSPMERVEEELVRLCNEKLREMDRQLWAQEGVDLANSLVRKYNMEGEILEFKKQYSYVPTTDGDQPDESKACYMGKAYWKQFLKRHGHRLEVRRTGRTGPQTPMVKVEERLAEIVNGMGRPVRPAEGVRLALTLIEGTEIENELREFKVNTLKQKSAMNNRGELLGPGYWRAFLRRNGHLLINMDEEKKENAPDTAAIAEIADAAIAIPTDVVHAHDVDEVGHPPVGDEDVVHMRGVADMRGVDMRGVPEHWYNPMHTHQAM